MEHGAGGMEHGAWGMEHGACEERSDESRKAGEYKARGKTAGPSNPQTERSDRLPLEPDHRRGKVYTFKMKHQRGVPVIPVK